MENKAIEKELCLINYIIYEAIDHGGDSGGAYCSNAEGLNDAILDWLKLRGLDKLYSTNYEIKGTEHFIGIGRITEDKHSFEVIDW